ncbi:PPC domain-containing protein [Methylomarinum vadi]|uniref:PPC domain-containing protein n=1 Tax=Methylomarinum vadi TaxID=438855 RepID=UPI0004DED968|nr:PPC domain-containing protein [Methylomarinum vadi]
MMKKNRVRQTMMLGFGAWLACTALPYLAWAETLSDDTLSEEQIMTLTDIDMEIDDIADDQLDPATKPEGFDELVKALDEIDRNLQDLENTAQELEAGEGSPAAEATTTRPDDTAETAEAITADSVESESNNSFGKADPIALNGEISGTIQPRRDADWYRLAVPEQGQLVIASKQVPDNIDLVLRVWNGNKETISNWYSPLRKGGELNASIDLKSPGDYFLEVHDGRDDSHASDGYRLELQFTPSGDRFEPNDSFGKAAPIDLESSLQATILPQRDVDWYRFEIAEQGELKIVAEQVAENLAIVFRLWNANKETITNWFAPLSKGGPTEAVLDLPEPGSYYLEVHDDRDDQRSVQPFTLTFEFKASGDRAEPNNSFAQAKPLPLGETVTATILPKRDADWYRVDVDKQGELTVEITQSPQDLDMVFRLWNGEKNTISNWMAPLSKGGDVMGKVSLPEPGSYYIEVHDGRDDARSVSPYRITATLQ